MPRPPRRPSVSATPQLPHLYTPREYQIPFWNFMLGDGGPARKRADLVWHRRAGKDTTVFNFMITASQLRVGSYYYFFPKYSQGRKILWLGRNFDGMPFRDHIPRDLVANEHDTDMRVTLTNGSSIQIIGTDNFDTSAIGTNPLGAVFSEYALQDPRAWDFLRPIFMENQGWAVFVYTPRGQNHAYKLHRVAEVMQDIGDRGHPWFSQVLTIRDTRKSDGSSVIEEADVEQARREGMDDETIASEFYCSFAGSVQGSYYAKLMREMQDSGRITRVPYEPDLPVYTGWDLGIGDSMAIWFLQAVGKEIRAIDYVEGHGEGLPYYAREIRNERNYVYEVHYLPHDAKVRDLSTGKARTQILEELKVRPLEVVPKLDPDDGIQAVRQLLPRMWIDETRVERGVACLWQYHKEWDSEFKVFKRKPFHDWSSNGADALRTFAVGYTPRKSEPTQTHAVTDIDVFSSPNTGVADANFSVL